MKNEIIITNLKLQINNFNDTNKDYDVDVYTQDETENDQYTIEVYEVNENEKNMIALFHCDSSGNFGSDEDFILKDELTKYIYELLFIKLQHGIIRGF